jgi:hypothetical protein
VNYRATARSLDELLAVTLREYELDEPPGHFTAVLESARVRQLDQREQNPSDVAARHRLAMIDFLLGFAYTHEERTPEADALLLESFELIDAIPPLDPELPEARWAQFRAVNRLVNLFSDVRGLREKSGLVLRMARRLEWIADQLRGSDHRIETAWYLTETLHEVSHRFAWIGEADRAREILAANGRWLGTLPREMASAPEVVLCRASIWTALDDDAGALDLVRTVAPAEAGYPGLRARVDLCLAETAARRLGWRGVSADAVELVHDAESPEAWAGCAALLLREQAAAVGRDPASAVRVGWTMRHFAHRVAFEQRGGGRIEEARRTIARLEALADRLVTAYPDAPAAWMLQSEAHQEWAKIAVEVDDAAANVRERQRALDAARQALARAPEDEEARQLVDDRRRRLYRAMHDHPPTRR